MNTAHHDTFMGRALELARLGGGTVAPNPLVGAVLVSGGRILAEGWHKTFGGPHAEVECLRAWGEDPLPDDAILYVTLEPCSHQGKTPPCADLLIARGVQRVVVAHEDPFPEVAGRGIAKLRDAGVEVTVGVGEHEARWTNRRFLMSVQEQRPYIILKWARSADGFLDRRPRTERGVQRITCAATDVVTHGWRAMEQAILVGSRTVVHDDPSLTVRQVPGRQPLRVVIDRSGITPDDSQVYDSQAPTLLVTRTARAGLAIEQHLLQDDADPLDQVSRELHRRGIRSLLVEGGAQLHQAFLQRGLWDEARIIQGTPRFGDGTPAPMIATAPLRTVVSDVDTIEHHLDPASPIAAHAPLPTWPW